MKIIEKRQNSREEIGEMLVRKGLSLQKKSGKPKRKLSDKERERLSELFSAPQSLGELISEDREEKF